jgi:hypothetical protein
MKVLSKELLAILPEELRQKVESGDALAFEVTTEDGPDTTLQQVLTKIQIGLRGVDEHNVTKHARVLEAVEAAYGKDLPVANERIFKGLITATVELFAALSAMAAGGECQCSKCKTHRRQTAN